MKVDIVFNYILPETGDWKSLGILVLVALFAIIGQMYASKHLKFMRGDAYQLSIAYLGVFLITASFLYFGAYNG